MPGGDGTGPLGRGPMTGRGMGECVVKLQGGGEAPEGFAGAAGWSVGGRTSAKSPFWGPKDGREGTWPKLSA